MSEVPLQGFDWGFRVRVWGLVKFRVEGLGVRVLVKLEGQTLNPEDWD